ncbi:hypothetical protein PCASD_12672 [Puccinia coronata f. sp. avenae]|uniref:DNA-directed DNA polymerase n=1 Tax=Puccinia coronata f. sp. avenae TaxID=200324 RepID=A0A2N5UDW6_9BASI|nr:hypothetical protein PCASD_12672 [Puccinia coronata f. sp. avenae]
MPLGLKHAADPAHPASTRRTKSRDGATVMEPLYPSIMMAHNLCYTTLTDTKMAKFPTHHWDTLTMPSLRHRHGRVQELQTQDRRAVFETDGTHSRVEKCVSPAVTTMWSSLSLLSTLTARSSSTGSSSSSTHKARWKRSYTITAKQSSSGAGLANHQHHHYHHLLHLHEQPGDAP